MDKRVFVAAVVGPTASGKTSLAVRLAEKLSGEIVSADSMQIYRGMDIATAAPTADELARARHHLTGFLEPEQTFSVSQYKELADVAIDNIVSEGKLPVVCGGTGLYISSLLENISFPENATDDGVRARLMLEFDSCGGEIMLARLAKSDPETAGLLHPNDKKRIVRALELYEITGKTMTQHNAESRLSGSKYNVCYIGLTASDRQFLYDRIDARVDAMLSGGLVDEARRFYSCHSARTAGQAIGYKELKPFLDGKGSLEEAADRLKRETRRYAKRQLTWFRRNSSINWFEIDRLSSDEIFESAMQLIMRQSAEAEAKGD